MTRPDLHPDPATPLRRFVSSACFAPCFFALLSIVMFIDVLFTSARVVSFHDTDLALQFIPWREFGFTQLAGGNLPLWNPHIYGGTPYFAGFQSALLYPPNWLHLVLPVTVAINWIVALHVMLAGYFTYLWSRGRDVSLGASLIAGTLFMFSGPYFLHIYAGHLPHLAVMVWTPLMLLAIDRLGSTGHWSWTLLGVLACAMHILGGHPQYVYYTGIVLTIYVLLQLIVSKHRLALLGGFAAIYAGAMLLTAIQLLPGIDAAQEFVRAGGTTYEFASTFGLPPRNFVTIIAPTFFGNVPLGDKPAIGYWGACYLWEVSLYLGVSGLILASLGLWRSPREVSIVAGSMIVICLVLALGRHTPLYRLIYDYVPQYSSFRGQVKFAYLAVLFLALMAGCGFDSLAKRPAGKPVGLALGAIAIATVTTGVLIQFAGEGWGGWVASLIKTAKDANEWFHSGALTDPPILQQLAAGAARSLYLAAAILVTTGALILLYPRHRIMPWMLLLLVCIEMFTFARFTRATTSAQLARAIPEAWRQPIALTPASMRILTVTPTYANRGLSFGFENLNGYDPGILKRYAELLFVSQGLPPDHASQYIPFRRVSPSIFRLLRCGLVCANPDELPAALPSPLPLAYPVSDWVKLSSRDTLLGYIARDNFDAATTVVLESDPGIKTIPSASAPGKVSSRVTSTDSIELDVAFDRPAIVVVGTNYSRGWRIQPLESNQKAIQIVPANWTQIAIPLEAGNHRLILEYSPRSFRIGRWISLAAVLALSALLVLLMRKTARDR